jgi:hypothetical protein
LGVVMYADHCLESVARDNARSEGFVHVPAMLLPDMLRMLDDLRRLGVIFETPRAPSPDTGKAGVSEPAGDCS